MRRVEGVLEQDSDWGNQLSQVDPNHILPKDWVPVLLNACATWLDQFVLYKLDHPQVKECLSSKGYDEREVDDKELAEVLFPLEIVDAAQLADESYEKQKEQQADCLDDEKAINQHLCVCGYEVAL